ncbi:MAG: PAS domain S-box protein [Herminiimonas sp.]|nr:PAS domain S-box protein [Herminiimonas sp.]
MPRLRLSAIARLGLARPGWRWLLPLLTALLVIAVLLSLVWLPLKAQRLESTERQEQLIADTLWVEQAIRFQFARDEDALRQLGAELASGRLTAPDLQARLAPLLRTNHELRRVAWIGDNGQILAASDEPVSGPPGLASESAAAADRARRTGIASYSQPAATGGLQTSTLLEYHVPLFDSGRYRGSLVASYSTALILEEMVPWWFAQDNEITLSGGDDNVIERRAAGGAGRGIYTHAHALDLPGANLTLRTNSIKVAPKLFPNLLVGAVVALALALLASLVALWRDINRRLAVEGALRQQVSFRTAMENSLVTGLRARDLDGRVTYVNPAFCQMVGTQADELLGRLPPMPYWAPEAMAEYQQRFSEVLAGTITPQGFETIFQRASGKRFPVLIFESPLVDASGRQTGWMGSILDISDRKRVEELNRQQQEKLQTSARLASMGEIASTVAHELNQPLAAISSYTTGALNILHASIASGNPVNAAALEMALQKASSQAQRAGQIIRSVHAFVKQRETVREAVPVQALIDGVVSLIELQAQKFFVGLQFVVAPQLPPILADRVLIEQVLLNLTRNAIEAMQDVAPVRRILRISAMREPVGAAEGGHATVLIAVTDQGHGIAADIGERLFSPFFSTKAEGMGMGLNICRTAIEFHGGRLTHRDNPGGGTIFEFTLPTAVLPATDRNSLPASA